MFTFKEQVTRQILECLVQSMGHENVVVKVEAATAISKLLLSNEWCTAAKPIMCPILEKFLSITDQLGSHHMLDITTNLIDCLGDDIIPYAVQLLQKMLGVFESLYQEAYCGGEEIKNDEAFVAAVACFGSFKILISGCHGSPQSLDAMIPVIDPLVKSVFSGKQLLPDFFEDTCSLIESFFSFCSPTPNWCYEQYEKIIEQFFLGKRNMLHEMLDPLTSLIPVNPQAFVAYKNGFLVNQLVLMIENILVDECDEVATTASRVLICCLLLNCEGLVDPVISSLMKILQERTTAKLDDIDNKNLAATFAVICWYNPNLFVECGGEQYFGIFERIAKELDWFERRIVILSFCRVLAIPPDKLSKKLQPHLPNVLCVAWDLILYSKECEIAIEDSGHADKLLKDALQKSTPVKTPLLDVADGADLDPKQYEDTLLDLDGDFLEFLQMIEEDDTNFKSPLDHVNEILEFWHAMQNVQQNYNQLFQSWMSQVPEHLKKRYEEYLEDARKSETSI